MIGSLATLFTRGSPLATMLLLARNMKMWGILVAIGGTMPTLKIIESGLFNGELIRQMVVILASFAGTNVVYWLVVTIAGAK
ncbi:MAG: YtrH family sporulation protein [Limnochordia bacterium]